MEKIKQKIQTDLTQAIKKGDEICRSTLRMLLAAILSKEKEKRYKVFKEEPDLNEDGLAEKSILTDEEIIEVIFSEVKKRKEAIEGFSAYGGPAEGREKNKMKDKIKNFVKKEKSELRVLQAYLPEQLSEEEIKKIVQEAIKKTGAKEMKDMGKVMGEIMPKVKGKADGNLVGRIVKKLLSKVE